MCVYARPIDKHTDTGSVRLDLDDLGGEVCLVDFSDNASPVPTVSRFCDLNGQYSDVRNRSRLCDALHGEERNGLCDNKYSDYGLVHGVLSNQDLTHLKTLFDSIDEDGGGTIDKDESTSETKGGHSYGNQTNLFSMKSTPLLVKVFENKESK